MANMLIEQQYSPNILETEEGYLVCKGVPIARTGTQLYSAQEGLQDSNGKPLPNLNGMIEVKKDADLLFAPATIASFENKPITLGHKEISPDNWRRDAVGISTNVRPGEGDLSHTLISDLLITDKTAIDVIKQGNIREISLGYNAAYESDGPGKAHQTLIRGNHVAIVPRGKAGAICRIRDEQTPLNSSKREKPMDAIDKALNFLSFFVPKDDNSAVTSAHNVTHDALPLQAVNNAPVNMPAGEAPPAAASSGQPSTGQMILELLTALKTEVDSIKAALAPSTGDETEESKESAPGDANADDVSLKPSEDEQEETVSIDPSKAMRG